MGGLLTSLGEASEAGGLREFCFTLLGTERDWVHQKSQSCSDLSPVCTHPQHWSPGSWGYDTRGYGLRYHTSPWRGVRSNGRINTYSLLSCCIALDLFFLWCHALYPVILVGSFHLGIFCDAMIPFSNAALIAS